MKETLQIHPISLILRRIFLVPIFFYRYIISPILPPSCRFVPSCSVYAVEAVMIHGIVRGAWLILRRLVRCHPWGASGFDPVPPPSSFSPYTLTVLSAKTPLWMRAMLTKKSQTDARHKHRHPVPDCEVEKATTS